MRLCSHHLVHLWHLELLHSLPPLDEESARKERVWFMHEYIGKIRLQTTVSRNKEKELPHVLIVVVQLQHHSKSSRLS